MRSVTFYCEVIIINKSDEVFTKSSFPAGILNSGNDYPQNMQQVVTSTHGNSVSQFNSQHKHHKRSQKSEGQVQVDEVVHRFKEPFPIARIMGKKPWGGPSLRAESNYCILMAIGYTINTRTQLGLLNMMHAKYPQVIEVVALSHLII